MHIIQANTEAKNMTTDKIKTIAEAYKAEMLAINPAFPVTKEAMAISVWTQLSPMERFEIISQIEKMPKSISAKQARCLKEVIKHL